MNLAAKRIGLFKVDGKIGVGDPCYSRPDCIVMDAVDGPWAGYAMLSNTNWGVMVAELIAVCKNYKGDIEKMPEGEHVGVVGVDSGQMVIANADQFPTENEYDAVCHAHAHAGGVIQNGIVSSTGYGDGGYNIYAQKDGGKVTAVRVVFISDEEEESEDEE